MRTSAVTALAALASTAAAAPVVTPAIAAPAHLSAHRGPAYAQGRWTGITYGDNFSRLRFTVAGSRLKAFVDQGVGCLSYPGGYQVTSLALPKQTAIGRSGRFDEVTHPFPGVTDELKGRFTSARRASGTLTQSGNCDTGLVSWVAQAGPKAPPPPPKPPLPACTRHNCRATDGLLFDVTGVDTTLTSVQNPNAGPYSNTVDSQLAQTGGVLVTLTATNLTGAPISITTTGGEWTLQDRAGGHDTSRDETDLDVVTQDGTPTDGTTCANQLVTVDAHATSAPITLCFAVPQSARTGMAALFDYPTTMARIPLG